MGFPVSSHFSKNYVIKFVFLGYKNFFTRFVDKETVLKTACHHCKQMINRIVDESKGKFKRKSKFCSEIKNICFGICFFLLSCVRCYGRYQRSYRSFRYI